MKLSKEWKFYLLIMIITAVPTVYFVSFIASLIMCFITFSPSPMIEPLGYFLIAASFICFLAFLFSLLKIVEKNKSRN